jgi:hypothetical protein
MAESSCWCWSHARSSVCQLNYDIGLHPLLGADEVSWDITVADNYQTGCFWRSLSMLVTVSVVPTTPQFCVCFLFFFFFSVRFPLFPVCWYVVRSEISGTSLLDHLSIVPDFPDLWECYVPRQRLFWQQHIYPKASCELNCASNLSEVQLMISLINFLNWKASCGLNCTSKGFSYNFLDLAVK